MSSRADYLAKYLSGGQPKKSKKKSKKQQPEPAIVVEGISHLTTKTEHHEPTVADDPDDEFAPVSVAGVSQKPNAGFKRIDTGEIVKAPAPDPTTQSASSTQPASTQPHQNTVYRDKSGRIINIDEKRAELESAKQAEEAQQKALTQQVNSGDMDRVRRQAEAEKERKAQRFAYSKTDREYVEHMSAKPRFDDPLNSFAPPEVAPEPTLTGRPVYSGGVHALNRFNIPSGHFWDGTDRSNGFEERLVRKRDEQKVTKVTETAVQESYTEYDFD